MAETFHHEHLLAGNVSVRHNVGEIDRNGQDHHRDGEESDLEMYNVMSSVEDEEESDL